jgi:hypothetical protein
MLELQDVRKIGRGKRPRGVIDQGKADAKFCQLLYSHVNAVLAIEE